MTAQDTSSNLAARALFDAAFSHDLTNYRTDLDSIPDAAAHAIVIWATQRGVPLDWIEERGGTLEYAGRAVYCFRFGSGERYNGVLCVDGDGTVLAEDSRISVCP
jgi:hypothetical protein